MKGVLNTKGQATVEAVLMLLLGVTMVVGLMQGFSKSFSEFTELYFGNYFSCLIQNGELPKLQYKDTSGNTSSVCEKEFQSFSLAEGWAANSSSGSSTSSSNGSKKKSSKSSASSRRPTRGVNESGSGSQRFALRSGRGSSSGGGSSDSSGSKGKKKNGSSQFGGTGVGTYGAFSNGNDGEVQVIRIKRKSKKKNGSAYGLYKDPGDNKIKVKGSLNKSDQVGLGGKKTTRLKIDRTVAKVKKKEESGFQMNFSSIMRFLIIAALLIVIIIVIGGQLLSISKSFE